MEASPLPPLRVLLAVDYAIVREALAALIETQPDMLIVAETDSGRAASQQAVELRPDVVVMDLSNPALSLVVAVRTFRQQTRTAKLLVLLQQEKLPSLRPVPLVVSELSVHAHGYFFKDGTAASTRDFLLAVRAVADGKRYQARLPSVPTLGYINTLTPREAEVLQRVACGFSSKEIAAQFDLSQKTVETYKKRAMEKASLKSRVEIVRYAVQQGWLGAVESN